MLRPYVPLGTKRIGEGEGELEATFKSILSTKNVLNLSCDVYKLIICETVLCKFYCECLERPAIFLMYAFTDS